MESHVGELRLPITGVGVPRGRFTEQVAAERVDDSRFRVLQAPGAVEGLAEGDLIEISEDDRGFRLMEHSGNLCIWIYANVGVVVSEQTFDAALGRQVRSLGGRFRVASRSHWAVTLHVSVGFDHILALLDGFVLRGGARCWFYGNVYESHTGGEPLGWWNDDRFYR